MTVIKGMLMTIVLFLACCASAPPATQVPPTTADCGAHETLDPCQGYPERTGEYHYHSLSTCIEQFGVSRTHSPIAGYSFDGFGI
jgi:hypothetical protein